MKKNGIIFLLTCLGFAKATAQQKPPIPKNSNEQTVLSFYDAGLNRKDFEAASKYMGAAYIQHNPMAADGAQGFKAYVTFLKENHPQSHWTFTQIFSDGNCVILHVHEQLAPAGRGNAVIDIFRLQNGKIVEHWDVVQPIPEKPENDNTMF